MLGLVLLHACTLGLTAVTAACARGLRAAWLLAYWYAPWQEAAGRLQGCPAQQETKGQQDTVSTCRASLAVAKQRCATARLQATCWSHQSHADSVGVVLLTLHLGVRVESLTACSCGADSSTQVPEHASAAACHAPQLEADGALEAADRRQYTHTCHRSYRCCCCLLLSKMCVTVLAE